MLFPPRVGSGDLAMVWPQSCHPCSGELHRVEPVPGLSRRPHYVHPCTEGRTGLWGHPANHVNKLHVPYRSYFLALVRRRHGSGQALVGGGWPARHGKAHIAVGQGGLWPEPRHAKCVSAADGDDMG